MQLIHAAALMALFATSQANAQSLNGMPNAGVSGQSITTHFQISQAMPATASTAEMTTTMSTATQALTDIVNRECDVLTATLKGSCRVVQVNVLASINDRMNTRNPVVNASANATFEITPPAPAAAAEPITPQAGAGTGQK